MARFTVREFAKSVGLETTGADYVAAGIMLKVLCDKGIAKEVDRINTSKSGKGRKSVVFDVPTEIRLSVQPVVATQTVVEPVADVVESEVSVVVAEPVVEVVEETKAEVVAEVMTPQFFYGDDDEEEEAA
jgi:hypothetical protein